MLRADIEKIIENTPDSSRASVLICAHMDYEIGLAGNGWFDDDSVLEPVFADDPGNRMPEIRSEIKAALQADSSHS